MVTDGNENHKKWLFSGKWNRLKKVCRIFYKGITIFYHIGDLDYRFLPFKRAYADYGISSRVRHFSAEKIASYNNFSARFHTAGVTISQCHLPIQPSVKTVFLCSNYLFYNNFSTLQKNGGRIGFAPQISHNLPTFAGKAPLPCQRCKNEELL